MMDKATWKYTKCREKLKHKVQNHMTKKKITYGAKYNIMEKCTKNDGHFTQNATQWSTTQWRCTIQQTTMHLVMEMNCACKKLEYNQCTMQCNGDKLQMVG